MEPDGMLHAVDAARLLSDASGESYELAGRLAGGETGAHELRGPDGRRVVVKWEREPASRAARRRAMVLADRLREEAGWPVPQQRAIEAGEWLFVIQEFMAGGPIQQLTHALVAELLDVHSRSAGLARPEDASLWPLSLILTLTVGGDDYCRHEPLREYDARTARLVEMVEHIGREIAPDDLGGGDIVHWDFHPGNLLTIDGHLAAVVDTDFMTTGDAAFDLVTLAMTSLALPCDPGVRDRLFEAAIDPLGDAQRWAYVGHLLVRFIDWPIRRGRPDEVEFWLRHVDRLLPR